MINHEIIYQMEREISGLRERLKQLEHELDEAKNGPTSIAAFVDLGIGVEIVGVGVDDVLFDLTGREFMVDIDQAMLPEGIDIKIGKVWVSGVELSTG